MTLSEAEVWRVVRAKGCPQGFSAGMARGATVAPVTEGSGTGEQRQRGSSTPDRVQRQRGSSTADRVQRQRIASEVAEAHSGVARCSALTAAGISRDVIRAEIEAERWTRMGRHTVGITSERDRQAALRWRAVWESGSGVVLDGVTSLQAAGLTGWSEDLIHVSVPGNSRLHEVDGVRAHRLRRVGEVITAGIPLTRPEVAVIRAATWVGTDRQAATLLAMTIQQRLAHPDRVLDVWSRVQRCRRRALLSQIVADVCNGAHSLDELDFAAMCRAHGLPEPTRQVVRKGRRGRIYLDVGWEDLGVHVEIDGAQHARGSLRSTMPGATTISLSTARSTCASRCWDCDFDPTNSWDRSSRRSTLPASGGPVDP